jgi:LEA14-like dessication related protein
MGLTLLFMVFFFSACKSKPVIPEAEAAPSTSPSATLAFTGIQAEDLEHLKVLYSLEVKAPSGSRAMIESCKIESWRVLIDEVDASLAFSLNYPQGDFPVGSPVPLTLGMDIAALAAKGLAPKDDYSITSITELDVNSGLASPAKISARLTAKFPGVQAPLFTIASIAILKAELINTRFRVNMKIDNPNPFPLELSGFAYELYGNGRLWADATEKKPFVVEGKSSMQGDLYLIMNFINMERGLLNQIINLVDVNYRFKGEAQVSTGIDYLPKFNTGFDLSGYSEVLEK